MRRIVVSLILVLALALPLAAVDTMKYSLLDREQISSEVLSQMLKHGAMLMIKEKPGGALDLVTSGIVVNAPPHQVLAAIHDYGNFSQFMPSVEDVKVVSRDGDKTNVWFHIKFTFSVLSYTVKYTLTHHEAPGRGYWWELVDGDLLTAIGSWEAIPLQGGKKTAVIYSNYTDIRSISKLVKFFIDKEPSMEAAINASTCLLVLKALRDRVESGAYASVAAPAPVPPAVDAAPKDASGPDEKPEKFVDDPAKKPAFP